MTLETLHKVSHLCEEDQEAQSSDVIISSISSITNEGAHSDCTNHWSDIIIYCRYRISKSLIGQDLWEKCKYDQAILEPWLKRLVIVDGSPIRVLGSCKVRIS